MQKAANHLKINICYTAARFGSHVRDVFCTSLYLIYVRLRLLEIVNAELEDLGFAHMRRPDVINQGLDREALINCKHIPQTMVAPKGSDGVAWFLGSPQVCPQGAPASTICTLQSNPTIVYYSTIVYCIILCYIIRN